MIKNKFKVVFFVLIVLVFFIFSSIFIHRLYLMKFYFGSPAPEIQNSILETNSFSFSVDKYSVGVRGSKIISAATKFDDKHIVVATSSRDSKIIKLWKYSDRQINIQQGLKELRTIDLNTLNVVNNFNDHSVFIFDILFENKILYVSLVEIPNNSIDCDIFRIIKIDIFENVLGKTKSSNVWRSPTCTKSFPNNPNWTDFHGRMAIHENKLYLTTGLFVASTVLGVYPNPALYNLEKSLLAEMKKDRIFGKVLEIDLREGGDNFWKVLAEGFRGPSGITIQKFGQKKNIWLVDHGPRGGDELNLILRSKNYGWPQVSYGIPYVDDTPTANLEKVNTIFNYHEGYEKPIFYWSPSVAPSSLITLSENLDSNGSWAANDIVMGTLKDESLMRLKINKNLTVQSVEKLNLGTRIRDLTAVNKSLIVSTDDGQVYILNPIPSKNISGPFPPIFKEQLFFYSKLPGVNIIVKNFDSVLKFLANQL